MSDASKQVVRDFVDMWSGYKFSESIHKNFYGVAASVGGNSATVLSSAHLADVLNSLPALVKELDEAKKTITKLENSLRIRDEHIANLEDQLDEGDN